MGHFRFKRTKTSGENCESYTSKNEGKMPDSLYHLATSDSKVNQDFIVMILN